MNTNEVVRPDWFRAEPGFKWFDDDGDLCVYLGIAGYRTTDYITLEGKDKQGGIHTRNETTIVFEPIDSEVIVYHYKNEWHLANLARMEKDFGWDWSECKPADSVDKCNDCHDYYAAVNGTTVVEKDTTKMSFYCNNCLKKYTK